MKMVGQRTVHHAEAGGLDGDHLVVGGEPAVDDRHGEEQRDGDGVGEGPRDDERDSVRDVARREARLGRLGHDHEQHEDAASWSAARAGRRGAARPGRSVAGFPEAPVTPIASLPREGARTRRRPAIAVRPTSFAPVSFQLRYRLLPAVDDTQGQRRPLPPGAGRPRPGRPRPARRSRAGHGSSAPGPARRRTRTPPGRRAPPRPGTCANSGPSRPVSSPSGTVSQTNRPPCGRVHDTRPSKRRQVLGQGREHHVPLAAIDRDQRRRRGDRSRRRRAAPEETCWPKLRRAEVVVPLEPQDRRPSSSAGQDCRSPILSPGLNVLLKVRARITVSPSPIVAPDARRLGRRRRSGRDTPRLPGRRSAAPPAPTSGGPARPAACGVPRPG